MVHALPKTGALVLSSLSTYRVHDVVVEVIVVWQAKQANTEKVSEEGINGARQSGINTYADKV